MKRILKRISMALALCSGLLLFAVEAQQAQGREVEIIGTVPIVSEGRTLFDAYYLYIKDCSNVFIQVYADRDLAIPVANPFIVNRDGSYDLYITSTDFHAFAVGHDGKEVYTSSSCSCRVHHSPRAHREPKVRQRGPTQQTEKGKRR